MALVPYMCASDDVMSDLGNQRLQRNGTIALGAHHCDFTYKIAGEARPLAAQYPDRIRIVANSQVNADRWCLRPQAALSSVSSKPTGPIDCLLSTRVESVVVRPDRGGLENVEMNYRNQSFSNERIDLDGKSFHECTFENCELVFSGDRPPTFSDNRYVNTTFVLTGHAVRTVYLLSNIYHAGKGGEEVVESLISDIKNSNVHGHEIKTAIPNTPDHSMV